MRLIAATFLLSAPLFVAGARPAAAAPSWRCEARMYGDSVCDCGCGSRDSDCSGETFEICERSGCASGQVPWEHAPESCMSSACGDGWVDDAAGEVCDDGEALAGGGCAARCEAVNDGWACGVRAEKCTRLPNEADTTDGDATAGIEDAGQPEPPPADTTGEELHSGDAASLDTTADADASVVADVSPVASADAEGSVDTGSAGPTTGGAEEAPAGDSGCTGGSTATGLLSLSALLGRRRKAA